jgi:type IV secretory pathway TrbL component
MAHVASPLFEPAPNIEGMQYATPNVRVKAGDKGVTRCPHPQGATQVHAGADVSEISEITEGSVDKQPENAARRAELRKDAASAHRSAALARKGIDFGN